MHHGRHQVTPSKGKAEREGCGRVLQRFIAIRRRGGHLPGKIPGSIWTLWGVGMSFFPRIQRSISRSGVVWMRPNELNSLVFWWATWTSLLGIHMKFQEYTRILFNINSMWTPILSPYNKKQDEQLRYMSRPFNKRWRSYYKRAP